MGSSLCSNPSSYCIYGAPILMKKNKEIKREIQHLKTGTRIGITVLVALIIAKLISLLRFGFGSGRGRGGLGGPGEGVHIETRPLRAEGQGQEGGVGQAEIPQLNVVTPTPGELVEPNTQQPTQQLPTPVPQQPGQTEIQLPGDIFSVLMVQSSYGNTTLKVWHYTKNRALINHKTLPLTDQDFIASAAQELITTYNNLNIDKDYVNARILIIGASGNFDDWAIDLLSELTRNFPSSNFRVGFKSLDSITVYTNYSYTTPIDITFYTRQVANAREANLSRAVRYPWYSAEIRYDRFFRDLRSSPYLLIIYNIVITDKEIPTIGNPSDDYLAFRYIPSMVQELKELTEGRADHQGTGVSVRLRDVNNTYYQLPDDGLEALAKILFNVGFGSIYISAQRKFKISKYDSTGSLIDFAYR